MADRPIVLMLTNMDESGMRLLHEAVEVRKVGATDRDAIAREIVDADGLILRTAGNVDDELLSWGKRLKVVGRHGVGYDQIDVAAATRRGVQVVYTPGANTESVCEHVFAMMIGLSKHFPTMMRELAAGNYHARTSMRGREIAGRRLGIVGFGRIGRKLAEIAHLGFGMKVVYHDVVQAPEEVEHRAAARRVTFEELLQTAEYISMHVPLDASTRRMINQNALAQMQKGCILINTSRGPVVDEEAVADALDSGILWGYGGDVFDKEPPPPDHPLIGRPDVMLTPHSAAQTEEGLRNMATGVARDVLAVLEGHAPENPVNDPFEVERIRRDLGVEPLYRSML
jgi:D-3-phosphoglycerate dehydrogenase / 2-oxoglutarate reductase